MKTFLEFLRESANSAMLWDVLKECPKALQLLDDHRKVLKRGVRRTDNLNNSLASRFGVEVVPASLISAGLDSHKLQVSKFTVRNDRKPLNTRAIIHRAADIVLHQMFGWKPRSQGVFCSGSSELAEVYGEPSIIFPAGDFKYVWFKNAEDFFIEVSGKILERFDALGIDFPKGYDPDTISDNVITIVKNEIIKAGATDKNIEKVLADYEANEISVECPYFYCINEAELLHFVTKFITKLNNEVRSGNNNPLILKIHEAFSHFPIPEKHVKFDIGAWLNTYHRETQHLD